MVLLRYKTTFSIPEHANVRHFFSYWPFIIFSYADPEIFVRGGGGGGGGVQVGLTDKKSCDFFFFFFLVLSLFYRSQKVNLKEICHFSRF